MPFHHMIPDPRGTETESLFHYTSAEVGVFEIARRGFLRLGPAVFTNDPREHSNRFVTVEGNMPEGPEGSDLFFGIQGIADRALRKTVRLACFTRDFERPDNAMERDGNRGWAHPSLWAHYASGHSGVCLEFDRDAVVSAVKEAAEEGAEVTAGPVSYLEPRGPVFVHAVSWDLIQEFGPDAVLKVHVEDHIRELLFVKHPDWSPEQEFRIAVSSGSELPLYANIRSALKAIYLGPKISPTMETLARQVALEFGGLDVVSMGAHDGNLQAFPGSGLAEESSSLFPDRDDPLQTRVAALRESDAYLDQVARRKAWAERNGWIDTL